MIPILYERNEVDFTSNGLGRLHDCISCKVSEERNNLYECDFEYPVTGHNFDLIQQGRIIGVTHDESGDIQPFDIVSYSKPISGVVSFHAVHLSYRQSKMVSYGTGVDSLEKAFSVLRNRCYPVYPSGNPFFYFTDKQSAGVAAAFDGTPRSIRSLLGGTEGSILDAYGGEYEWDKWTVSLHKKRGVDRNFTIRYGLNMTNFTDESDISETYNACIPYYKSDDVLVIGNEVKIDRGIYTTVDECVSLDLSDKFESVPSVADLERMALSVMASQNVSLPVQTINVEFIRIQDEVGFDAFDDLLQCELCDTINVEFPWYGMSARFKIVKTEWDVLLDRYEKMELGALQTTLSQALGI